MLTITRERGDTRQSDMHSYGSSIHERYRIESERQLQLRTINRIEPNPNALDMGNQIRIVDLLPDSNVDFPRQQQTIDR